MEQIKIINKRQYLIPAFGKIGGNALFLAPFISIIFALFILIFSSIAGGLKFIIICVSFAYFYVSYKEFQNKGEYIPKQSFAFQRQSKRKISFKNKLHVIVFEICLSIVLYLLVLYILSYLGMDILHDTSDTAKSFKENLGKVIFFCICAPMFFGLKASLKVHEDVDLVAVQSYEDFVKLEIDEKIVTSYQNFDGTINEYKNGDYLLIATSRKLFFASYKNGKWNSTVKSIKDISQIAIARGVFIGLINKRYLRLIFKDQTEVGVWLDAKTKESSNPDMFLKRFLACLDDSILGQANDGITNRRRRTIQPQSQSSNSTPNQSQISRMETESVEQQIGRKLDLTNLASDIHSGDTYQSERFIEL